MNRHYGMDWLRIGAFGLLIFYHIGMVFVPWDFHAKAPVTQDWVKLPMQAVNAWRLALLFVVSGYASRAIFSRQPSWGAFLWGRTKRLLPPLLFGVAVIVPLQPWLELVGKHGYAHGFWYFYTHDFWSASAIGGIILPTWNHLWFVGYLWSYTLLLALALALTPALARRTTARVVDRALAGPLILVVPIALLAANWAWTFPGVGETHALVDDWPTHRIYLSMFLFGFALRESATLWAGVRRWWLLAALLATLGFAFIASVELGFADGGARMGWTLWFWFGIARCFQSWGAVIALLGIADRYLNRDAPGRAMLTEAVFPFYIIHQTIIVGLAWPLFWAGLGDLAIFALLAVATVGGCWLFYRIGREIVPLRPLIGLRARKPVSASSVA